MDATLTFGLDSGQTGASKLLLLASPSEGLSVWKVKRCGQERTVAQEPVTTQAWQAVMKDHAAATWQVGNALLILGNDGRLRRVS